jgi:hypothetical protein
MVTVSGFLPPRVQVQRVLNGNDTDTFAFAAIMLIGETAHCRPDSPGTNVKED